MNKVLACITLIGFCVPLLATWEALGPEGGQMRSLVVSQTNDNILYGASYSYPTRIVKSTNGGVSWIEVGSYNGYAYHMVIDPSDILYTASSYYVYKSTNGGVTWTNSASTGVYAYQLAIHPTNPAIIYGSGYRYVSSGNYAMVFMKSTNSGANWTYIDIVSGGYNYGHSIAVDPVDPNNIFIGGCKYTTTYRPAIYRSTDGGSTFAEACTLGTGYYFYSLAIHPTNPNIVYAGSYTGGIHRSTDGGVTWTQMATNYYNYRMVTTPANPDLVFSGASTSLYRSTNAGVNWTTLTSGLYASTYYGLAVSKTNANKVYTSNYGGFFRSTNMGTNWTPSNNGIYFGRILDVGVAPSQTSTMYTEFEYVGVYKTTNAGTSWSLLPTPSTCGALCAFAVHNTNPNYVFGLEGSG